MYLLLSLTKWGCLLLGLFMRNGSFWYSYLWRISFVVDTDRDKIAWSVEIGCEKSKKKLHDGVYISELILSLKLYLKSWRCQLWIWWSQMQLYWRREAEPVKRISATVKSTIDTDSSSNTVIFLWNSPNVYTLVWKHTNKWRNICTFQIPSAKIIVM